MRGRIQILSQRSSDLIKATIRPKIMEQMAGRAAARKKEQRSGRTNNKMIWQHLVCMCLCWLHWCCVTFASVLFPTLPWGKLALKAADVSILPLLSSPMWLTANVSSDRLEKLDICPTLIALDEADSGLGGQALVTCTCRHEEAMRGRIKQPTSIPSPQPR